MSIKLMIDSASDINKQEAEKMGVLFMPIEVRFGEEDFLDGINLTPNEFFKKLEKSTELPKTSLINTFRWDEAFKEATADGSELIVISISSKLSGGCEAAKEVAKNYEGKVFVVDSLSATIGERLLLQYAQKLVSNGFSAKEIAAKLNLAKGKIKITAMVDTLKYLKMGGRISATTAFVGGILSIKPIVAVVDGEVKNVAKAMGVKKAFTQIKSIVEKEGEIDFDMPCGLIGSGNSMELINNFKESNSNIWKNNLNNINMYEIGCTIGTHVGPGAVGIAYFVK